MWASYKFFGILLILCTKFINVYFLLCDMVIYITVAIILSIYSLVYLIPSSQLNKNVTHTMHMKRKTTKIRNEYSIMFIYYNLINTRIVKHKRKIFILQWYSLVICMSIKNIISIYLKWVYVLYNYCYIILFIYTFP